jgi:hypothetical protein
MVYLRSTRIPRPGGSVWCGEDYPEPLRNSFVITRFGNLWRPHRTSALMC